MGHAFAIEIRRIQNVAAIWWKFCPKLRRNSRLCSFGLDFTLNSSKDPPKIVLHRNLERILPLNTSVALPLQKKKKKKTTTTKGLHRNLIVSSAGIRGLLVLSSTFSSKRQDAFFYWGGGGNADFLLEGRYISMGRH